MYVHAIVLFFQEYYRAVQDYGDIVAKLHDFVDMPQRYFVEGTRRADGVDDKIVLVDHQGVVVEHLIKQQADVELIGAVGSVAVFLVEVVNDFFCDHFCVWWITDVKRENGCGEMLSADEIAAYDHGLLYLCRLIV